MNRDYLGDSVYIEWDGNGFTLTTENGRGPSNTIYMEPEVVSAFQAYLKQTAALAKPNQEE